MPNQTLYDNFSQVRQYIDQNQVDLSSYVSKTELANASYVTSTDLSNYLPLSGGIINGNITPSTTNSVSLGDNTYLYAATYSSQVNVGNNSKMYNDAGGITFSINSNNGVRIGSSAVYPKTSGGFSLGSSSNVWGATYTENLYFNSTNKFSNRNNNQVNLMLNNAWRYVFHINNFSPAYDNAINLGESSVRWKSTYTSNLYLGNSNIKDLINGMFSYDSTTGTLTITTLS